MTILLRVRTYIVEHWDIILTVMAIIIMVIVFVWNAPRLLEVAQQDSVRRAELKTTLDALCPYHIFSNIQCVIHINLTPTPAER